MHHGGNWFKGEHDAIVDRPTFDRIQQLLTTKAQGRKAKRSESGALLAGKLYDDRGNRMSPSFSSKNGVRYRFYVSSALLRGRKEAAGSVSRIAATEIESAVLTALSDRKGDKFESGAVSIDMLERIVISQDHLKMKIADGDDADGVAKEIKVARSTETRGSSILLEGNEGSENTRNEGLIQTVVRAHVWVQCLQDGTYDSIEQLAEANRLHPKVIRQNLRLAFLSPSVTFSILEGRLSAGLSLARIPKLLSLSWTQHRSLLG
jgi:hypothetical protein